MLLGILSAMVYPCPSDSADDIRVRSPWERCVPMTLLATTELCCCGDLCLCSSFFQVNLSLVKGAVPDTSGNFLNLGSNSSSVTDLVKGKEIALAISEFSGQEKLLMFLFYFFPSVS